MASIINSDDGVISGTAGLKSTGANDGALNIQTNGSNAISISSGQRSTFPTTIGVGGATPATSGSGITFPATASASSDANTLDDYEEGTFTPTLIGSTSGAATYLYQNGSYTKVGRVVTVNVYVEITSVSTISGTVAIGNMPFTVGGILPDTSAEASGSISIYSGLSSSVTGLGLFASNSETVSYFRKDTTGTANANLINSDIGNSFGFRASITYFT